MRSILNTATIAIEMLYVSVEQWMSFINSIKWQLILIIIVAAFYREIRNLIKGIKEIKYGSIGITIAYVPDVREITVGYAVEDLPSARETPVVDRIPTIEP